MINNTISTQPFLCIGDVYDKLKTKAGNRVRYTTYFTQLWNVLLEMFEYKNLPDSIPKRFFVVVPLRVAFATFCQIFKLCHIFQYLIILKI